MRPVSLVLPTARGHTHPSSEGLEWVLAYLRGQGVG